MVRSPGFMDAPPVPSPQTDKLITPITFISLAAVVGLLLVAHFAGKAVLPSRVRRTDRLVFVWLVFDGLIHCIFEGAFLYTSTFGKTAFNQDHWTAQLWREYAKADVRWGNADPTVVSLEWLTVVIGGPLSLYIAYLLSKDSMARHPWLLILSTGELYGGWMTFCPEWVTGSPNLRTDNFLHLWIYLFLMNTIWVFIPFAIMLDSYAQIMKAFSISGSTTTKSKKIR